MVFRSKFSIIKIFLPLPLTFNDLTVSGKSRFNNNNFSYKISGDSKFKGHFKLLLAMMRYQIICRSSHRTCSVNKGVLIAIFTGNYLCWSLFLIKLQAELCSFIFVEHLQWLLLCFKERFIYSVLTDQIKH